jgi:hypothetical protein
MFERLADEEIYQQLDKSMPSNRWTPTKKDINDLLQAQLKADMEDMISLLEKNENIDRGLDTCYIIYPSQLHALKKQLEEMK